MNISVCIYIGVSVLHVYIYCSSILYDICIV
nr:MAG TPA: hypothetical protein [Caudoviricetes sp.]